MLNTKEAMPTVAVKDISAATEFYQGVLGLHLVDVSQPGVAAFESGHAKVLAYESKYAGTNQATAVTWAVGDELELIVQSLEAKGIKFEHYDLPGLTRNGNWYEGQDMKVAWLKDPDGNILSLVTG